MVAATAAEMVDEPDQGRVFRTTRRVRLGDASPGGRLRLDALARMLQDVSDDDTRDAGPDGSSGWVVRRTTVEVARFPRYLEAIDAATWCSATGGRWAERRISIVGEGGGVIDSATLWVHLDPAAMRPVPLTDRFREVFAPAAAGRLIRASLHHDARPPNAGATVRPFPLRFTDFDVMGHVNNANHWIAVEELLARRRDLRAPLVAEVEHRAPIDRGADVEVVEVDRETGASIWILAARTGETCTTATVERRA